MYGNSFRLTGNKKKSGKQFALFAGLFSVVWQQSKSLAANFCNLG